MNIITEFRKKHGLTQEALAKELNCSQGRITHYETGRRTIDIEFARNLAKFANTLNDNISWDDIFGSITDQAA